jgi:NAD-dependent dihydropyrimidine dehydrogenase PreA subunit
MTKILKAARMENCIGCALCELVASRLSKKTLSYTDSFIQIRKAKPGKPYFKAIVDYGKKTDYRVLCEICPGNCFDIVESE